MDCRQLPAILKEVLRNFSVIHLNESFIVVDGADFIDHLVSTEHLQPKYGGEYLRFAIHVTNMLSTFTGSSVDPIFVFSYESQIIGAPTSIQSTVLTLLSYSNFKILFTKYPITKSVSSLACFLKCPILGSNFVYYLLITGPGSSSNLPPFVPLDQGLELQTDSTGCGIKVDAYLTDNRRLGQLAEYLYPILGMLYGPSFADHPILQRINSTIAPLKRFSALIHFLSSAGARNPNTLIDELFRSRNPHITAARHDSEHFSNYVVDSQTVGKELFFHLELTQSERDRVQADRLEANTTNSLDIGSEEILQRLMEDIPMNQMNSHGTQEWTDRLLHAYHQGHLFPFVAHESFNSQTELMESTNSLQSICQSLVSSVFPGHAYPDSSLHTESLKLYLDCKQDSTDVILGRLMNMPTTIGRCDPDWLVGLALALSIWYHQSNSTADIDHCPLILAIAASAIANVDNVDVLGEALCMDYTRLIEILKREYEQASERVSGSTQSSDNACQFEVVPQFEAVHSIYAHLQSLVSILNHILPEQHKSECFTFLPGWMLFPSGMLVYYLTVHLQLQLPFVREDQVCHVWLPKIYRGQKSDTHALSRLKDTYSRLIQLVKVILPPRPAFLHSPLELHVTNAPGSCELQEEKDCSSHGDMDLVYRDHDETQLSSTGSNSSQNESSWSRGEVIKSAVLKQKYWVRSEDTPKKRYALSDFTNRSKEGFNFF